MNHYLQTSRDVAIWEFLDDTEFKADMYDFYYDQPDAEIGYTDSEMRMHIFTDAEMYKKFRKYYIESKHSLVSTTKETVLQKALRILTLEKISQSLTDLEQWELHQILDYTNAEVYDTSISEIIPWTDVSLWNGLRYAIYYKIPLSNLWQVLYHIENTDVGYFVYSQELWKHHVNTKWVVISREDHYREEERKMMEHLFMVQLLMRENKLSEEQRSDEYRIHFEKYVEKTWKSEDTKKLLELKFKMSIYEWERNTKKILQDIRRKGFGFWKLDLVGWTEA